MDSYPKPQIEIEMPKTNKIYIQTAFEIFKVG